MVARTRLALATLHRWPPLWLLCCVLVAGWYSLLQVGGLALTDSPLAFVALVPVLAGYLLVHHARRSVARRDLSDPFVDGLFFLVLFVVCGALIFLAPARLSWYYWLWRLDLLAVALFSAAVVVLFWGLGGASAMRSALLYLLLLWPYPLVWLQQTLGPLLVGASAGFGALAVWGLGLPIAISPENPTQFVGTGVHQFSIIISDSCSGMNALVGFLVIGLPLVLTWSGSRAGKTTWLLIGALAAFASNLLRVGILLYLAAASGTDFALGVVHPILGIVLFLGVFAGMVALARCFGLAPASRSRVPLAESRLAPLSSGFRQRATMAVVAALVLAIGETGLVQFGALGTASLPAVSASDAWAVLPQVEGWDREVINDIDWQNLFGQGTRARIIEYKRGDASVVVQFVATPNKGLLDTYSPESCNLFHGDRIVGVSTVNLGEGVTGRLIRSQTSGEASPGPLDEDSLYWMVPVTVEGQLYHARVQLLVDSEMLPREPVRYSMPAMGPTVRFQEWLDTALSSYPDTENGSQATPLDDYTVGFGREMVRGMVLALPAR